MSLVIRTARPDDTAAIVSLVNAAYRPSGARKGWTHESDIVGGVRINPEQVLALFVPDSFVFVAEQNSQLVACVHVRMENDCAHIGMLATHPDRQTRGYGKIMLEYVEKYALKNFAACQFEMVVISQRAELVAFYVRRGYQRTGSIQDYPVSAGVGIPKTQDLTVEVLRKSVGHDGE